MTYDEAIHQAEQIVAGLESSEALDMADYRKKAAEVKRLLDFCEAQLRESSRELENESVEEVH